ncbi:MAG: hypothetical protein KDB53_04830, partial [Planctomycetes bacterium]|nr:hypothetical protein [Planctomycetota bacterium]
STEGLLRIFDARDGRPVGNSMVHDGPIVDLVISPDGTLAGTASSDGGWRIFDIATQDLHTEIRTGARRPAAIRFTPTANPGFVLIDTLGVATRHDLKPVIGKLPTLSEAERERFQPGD